MLRKDAARLMEIALAGIPTTRFTDVIRAAFVGQEVLMKETDPDESLEVEEQTSTPSDASEKIPTVSSLSKAMKRKAPPPSTGSSKKPFAGVCSLSEAKPIYPTKGDMGKHLHCGVDQKFFSERLSSAIGKEAGYQCLWSEKMKAEGNIVPNCTTISSQKGQLSTHIRRAHLGQAVTCYVCNKKAWSADTWLTHMQKVHSELAEEDYFVASVSDIKSFEIKSEVQDSDL